MTKWVVNSSPIIVLSRLALLDIIDLLVPDVLVPFGVVQEVQAGSSGNLASKWLSGIVRDRVVQVPVIHPVIAGWDLGRGESEVLTWSYENEGRGVILDDLAARKCAASLGMPIRGTVGLLVSAKRHGLIAKLGPVLDSLPGTGFHISQALIDEAKRLGDE